MLSYAAHHITAEDEAVVLAVLRSDRLTQGPTVARFEDALAATAGCKHAVVVNSGTAALMLAIRALDLPGGTLAWTSPISFMATANAALLANCRIAFTDVDGRGLVAGWIQQAPLFIPVTLGGIPRPLSDRERQKTVVVDACHGPIALPDGATAACLSFHPVKHVACGEGGAVLTDDAELARRVRMLRDHGRESGRMLKLSGNYRLPDLNAALGVSQLTRYHENVTERQRRAGLYDEALKRHVRVVTHPETSARHLYQILVPQRDAFQAKLKAAEVGTQVHYRPIHLEPFYTMLGFKPGTLPVAERFAAETLSLPLFPNMTDEQQESVVNAVIEAVTEIDLGL